MMKFTLDLPPEEPRKRKKYAKSLVKIDYKKSKQMKKMVEEGRVKKSTEKQKQKAQELTEIDNLFVDIDEKASNEKTLERQYGPGKGRGKEEKRKASEPKLPSERRAEEHEKWKANRKKQGATNKDGGKEIQVTISYDPSKLPPINSLLMEVVQDHLQANYAEKDIDYWWNYMNKVGSVPFATVFKDESRYITLIYAAGFIQAHEGSDAERRTLESRPVPNPDYNPYERNVAQEGQHWGIQLEGPPPATHISPEERAVQRDVSKLQSTDPLAPNFVAVDDKGQVVDPKLREALSRNPELAKTLGILEEYKLSNIAPALQLAKPQPLGVREQVKETQKENLETFIANDTTSGDKIEGAEEAPDGLTLKWQEADRLALKPREAWQNAPFHLRKMVEWCYGHRRDSSTPENVKGVVGEFPTDMTEVYMYRPKYSSTDPVIAEKREAMRAKVMAFWNKSLVANKDNPAFDLKRNSYRVTMGAMGLSKIIDDYAAGHADEDSVRNAALKYFQGHLSVESLGAKPGPISTLDPTYEEYLKLCEKYNLTVGTLLHEANL